MLIHSSRWYPHTRRRRQSLLVTLGLAAVVGWTGFVVVLGYAIELAATLRACAP